MAGSVSSPSLDEEGPGLAGWLAGIGLIVLAAVVGVALWLRFHGL